MISPDAPAAPHIPKSEANISAPGETHISPLPERIIFRVTPLLRGSAVSEDNQ
jgi:hypothetical protein